ncbi:hypothetical protein B0H13DRAFT_2126008 [Mycena leptocephala]|nr:hypothetical protein B0H13DRAFT_2126008 [Mycena leptocephala]
MKFTSTFVSVVLVAVSVSAFPVQKRGVDPALVPQFGVNPGVNPTGTGDCDGINGIKIPCSCPPSRDDFIASLSANVAAGHDVNNPGIAAPFPTDNSIASQITRVQTSISSLQNLHGPGLAALQNGTPPPAPAPPAPAPPPLRRLRPRRHRLRQAIPCSCPPSRDSFIASLSANVAAGHDVNNPGVPAPFPTDNSVGSQIAGCRQLVRPGVGCPAASTTFSAQLKALTG